MQDLISRYFLGKDSTWILKEEDRLGDILFAKIRNNDSDNAKLRIKKIRIRLISALCDINSKDISAQTKKRQVNRFCYSKLMLPRRVLIANRRALW